MKALKIIAVAIVVVVVIIILVGGYFGLVPGVRAIFGSDKPRDLGVVASAASFRTASDKLGLTREDANAASSGSVSYQGSHQVNVSLTNEELSSLFQQGTWKRTWKLSPIADGFQIKTNQNGTVEVAGMLDLSKLNGYLGATGFNDIKSYTSKFGVLPNEIPFYVDGSGSVTGNKVSLNVTEADLGRIPLPTDSASLQAIESFVERRISGIPGLNIASLDFADGKANLKGTIPSVVSF